MLASNWNNVKSSLARVSKLPVPTYQLSVLEVSGVKVKEGIDKPLNWDILLYFIGSMVKEADKPVEGRKRVYDLPNATTVLTNTEYMGEEIMKLCPTGSENFYKE